MASWDVSLLSQRACSRVTNLTSRNGAHIGCAHSLARGSPGSRRNLLLSHPVTCSATAQVADMEWAKEAFPWYLQSTVSEPNFPCSQKRAPGSRTYPREEIMWKQIRAEAEQDSAREALLSSFLFSSILAHECFEHSLAFVLSNRLSNPTLLNTLLFEIFLGVLQSDDDVRCGALADLEACKERDPACCSLSHALLYFKGFQALQTHRIGHALWNRGQKVMALALQSRMSEVFAVDIHPGARIGKGILLDHATGVVIGETAVVGNNVSLLQNVTLGGTGKDVGDRHPKVADNVLIGASASVLGNIHIGKGAQIAAGSLVLKAVPAHTLVAGSPAKEVGRVEGNPATELLQWAPNVVISSSSNSVATSTSDDIVINRLGDTLAGTTGWKPHNDDSIPPDMMAEI